jgi:hypothetical protein
MLSEAELLIGGAAVMLGLPFFGAVVDHIRTRRAVAAARIRRYTK